MTARATPRLGKNSFLYRNTGTYGTPIWTLISNVKGLKTPYGFGSDDVSARITGGFEAAVNTLEKLSLSWTMFDDDGVDITAIRTAFNAASVVEIAVMNGQVSGGGDTAARGFRGFFQISKFDESQENDKAVTREVEATLTWPDPAAVTAGAGSAAPLSGTV